MDTGMHWFGSLDPDPDWDQCGFITLVLDPHHFNEDPDPAFYFYADPDPAPHQSEGESAVTGMQTLHSSVNFNEDPDLAFHSSADPTPAVQNIADPDPPHCLE